MGLIKMHKVFVYGTLRAYSDSPDPTHTLKGYDMYNYGQFPYLNKSDDPESTVVGNMLVVDEKGLEDLDKYEGVDRGLYTRENVIAFDTWHKVDVPCFVYVQKQLHPQLIKSGDWHNR